MKYLDSSPFSVAVSGPLAPECDNYFEWIDGRLVIESTQPPQILGDRCGCVREQLRNGRWLMKVCATHSTESVAAFGL